MGKEKDFFERKKGKKKEANHQGLWINEEAVEVYQKRIKECSLFSREDVGERRRLRIEFQKQYGLNEIEALNIANGFHVTSYLKKYELLEKGVDIEQLSSKEYVFEEMEEEDE